MMIAKHGTACNVIYMGLPAPASFVLKARTQTMTDIKTVPTKEACALAGVSRQTLYNRTKPIVAGHGRTPSQWSIADLERIKARKGVAK